MNKLRTYAYSELIFTSAPRKRQTGKPLFTIYPDFSSKATIKPNPDTRKRQAGKPLFTIYPDLSSKATLKQKPASRTRRPYQRPAKPPDRSPDKPIKMPDTPADRPKHQGKTNKINKGKRYMTPSKRPNQLRWLPR